MKVYLADFAGFCFGVKRAINMALRARKEKNSDILTYGPIIHNPQVVKEFNSKGIKAVNGLKNVKKGNVLIIRTHGVAPEREKEFLKKDLNIIDATCPFVKKAQKLAEKLTAENYQVVIIGEAEHPEVKGIKGYTKKTGIVIGNSSEAKKLDKFQKLGIVVQTTQSIENFRETVGCLLDKGLEIRIFNTICDATKKRQDSALKLANKVDIMIVIGGKNSANTKHLAELCVNTGVKTYHIEDASELKKKWFIGMKQAGITAGASTPDRVIKNVISTIKTI